MKITDLNFIPNEPVQKSIKISDTEYTVGIKRLSFGDMERIGSSSVAMLANLVIFDDGQTLTIEQAQSLDVATAAALLTLINEVSGPKA